MVDDGSARPGARARLRRATSPAGPAAARNTGLEHVTTELVAFLDSDTRAAAGLDRAARRALRRPARRGGRAASVRAALTWATAPAEVGPGRHVSYVPSRRADRARAPGGRFDPELRYGEDVDLIWRLVDAGWRVRYDPSVDVGHDEAARS